eukprot:UN22622
MMTCKNVEVQCTFHDIGCEVQLQRGNMKDHEDLCVCRVVSKCLRKQFSLITGLENKVNEQYEEIQDQTDKILDQNIKMEDEKEKNDLFRENVGNDLYFLHCKCLELEKKRSNSLNGTKCQKDISGI